MTINDIRGVLAEEINAIRAGNSSPAKLNAIVNATGKILASVRLEMDYIKAVGKTPNISMLNGPKPEDAAPPE